MSDTETLLQEHEKLVASLDEIDDLLIYRKTLAKIEVNEAQLSSLGVEI